MAIYTINYAHTHNPHTTYFANEVRGKATRIVRGKDNAIAFAKTVQVLSAYDYTGKRVELV